jgi:rod shape-determining protein MreC
MLKKNLILFAFFILLIFGLLTYQGVKGKSPFINFPLYPLRIVEQGISVVIQKVKNLFNTYIFIIGKEEENKRLKEDINRFKRERNKYIEAELENKRLREILKLKSEEPRFVTVAEVFARDPTNWFQMLWINKGKNSGIARDMVAVTPVGPIGRVYRVFDEGANIILITDVNSSVAVRLQSSRIDGILEGGGGEICYLKYIPKKADIQIGERVITSGLDGIYPEGLLIGYVSDVKKEGGEIFQIVEVKPAAELNAIEEVVILKR